MSKQLVLLLKDEPKGDLVLGNCVDEPGAWCWKTLPERRADCSISVPREKVISLPSSPRAGTDPSSARGIISVGAISLVVVLAWLLMLTAKVYGKK